LCTEVMGVQEDSQGKGIEENAKKSCVKGKIVDKAREEPRINLNFVTLSTGKCSGKNLPCTKQPLR